MSIRLAPNRPLRWLRPKGSPRILHRPANDNAAPAPHRDVLHAALRLFAEHGLAAAARAKAQAEAALDRGDAMQAARWHAITAALDSRLAANMTALKARLAQSCVGHTSNKVV